MRMRATLRLLAALFAFVLVAAACSDEDAEDVAAGDDADADAGDDTDADAADADLDDGGDDHDADADHDVDGDHDADGDDDMDTDGGHDHEGTVDIEGDLVPTIGVEVWSDPAGGVNIRALPGDFTIAPESASTDHVEGEGHFHLYVDGEKELRFYNECIYWPGVDEGAHTFAVELSSNDHRSYWAAGNPLRAELEFDVPAHGHDDHSHDDPVAVEWDGADTPALAVEIADDPKSGWNAFVEVEGLELSCDNASGDHAPGEGHLHIYANGEKLGRLYGTATHISALPAGEVEVSVAAFTNDHRPYVVGGAPVEASTAITVEVSS